MVEPCKYKVQVVNARAVGTESSSFYAERCSRVMQYKGADSPLCWILLLLLLPHLLLLLLLLYIVFVFWNISKKYITEK